MMTKITKLMKIRKIYIFVFLFMNIASLFANVLSHPRKINVISTEYFDILFPSECTYLADLVSKNVDDFYLDACEKLDASEKFRLPIVISPDSDELSVEYAPSPYNRIVIYSSIPQKQIYSSNDTLLSLLQNEILIMAARTKRSKGLKFISNIVGGDLLQPSYLLNAPYSFVSGINIFSDSDGNQPLLKDKFALQLLAQAKLEDKFPSWFQMSGSRDIYPDEQLSIAAMSAFSAYIQQRWGLEKYVELWNSFESFHPIKLFKGVFEQVYGEKLNSVWADFAESIPLPSELMTQEELDFHSEKLLDLDKDGLYEDLLSTPYGFIWFDNLKHEVSLFSEKNLISNTRSFLFLASDVTSLSLSPDERFLAVSFTRKAARENLSEDCVWIYDLKNLVFLNENYMLRDGCIIQLNKDEYAIAGISVKETFPELQVLYANSVNKVLAAEKKISYTSKNEIIYSKIFDYSQAPYSLCSADENQISYLLEQNGECYFCNLNIVTDENKFYSIKDSNGSNIHLNNLQKNKTHLNIINGENISEYVYSFQFFENDKTSFIKTGFITLNDDFSPKKIFLQDKDISGGIISLAFDKDSALISTRKLEHDELRRISFDHLPFKNGVLSEKEENIINDLALVPEFITSRINNKKITKMDQYFVKKYSPTQYMYDINFVPFLSIVDFSDDDRYTIQPGLGFSLVTQNDPLLNNKVTFSACYYFLPPLESITFSSSQDILDTLLYFSYSFYETIMKYLILTGQKTLSLKIENTSTPVDINFNTIADFYDNGQYQLCINGSTNWKIPLGMNFRRFSIGINSELRASSYYYDFSNTSYPYKFNYPSIDTSYRTIKLSLNGEFTNIHQYGISPYEKRGFSVGLNIYALWDFALIDEITYTNQEYIMNYINSPSEDILNDYISYNDSVFNGISQLNLNLFASLKIPQLTPLQNQNNWILSVPATINVNLFRKTGEALTANAEILLVGKEIQNGIPFLLLYFERAGLFLGYDATLNYNRYILSAPDFRNFESYKSIFANTVLTDFVYLKLNIDFSPVVGKFSTYILSSDINFKYFVRNNTFKLSFALTLNK